MPEPPLSDVQEALERQILEREQPPSHVEAARQLKQFGIKFAGICAVLSDSIIYRGPFGKVRTAWLKVDENDKVSLMCTDPGMPAWPSEDA